jgi:prophage regulatory protein
MKQDGTVTNKFLSKAIVGKMSNLSDVTLWRMEKRGEFPKRRQISPNRVAYLESEVLDWMGSRPVTEFGTPNRGDISFLGSGSKIPEVSPIEKLCAKPTRKAATNAIEQEDHLVEESPEAGSPGNTPQF